ncbi:MAG: DUF4199 domain-containing protein [Bacteroidota bacterium]
MKSTILKFGACGLLCSFLLFQLAFIFGKSFSYSTQEVLGYLTIVLSLLFVFFGIQHFKKNVNGGQSSFANGLLIGLSITAFVALGSAIADYIFVAIINPDFAVDYTAYQPEQLQAKLSPAEFEVAKAELEAQMQSISSPFAMAAIMFVTVLLLGIIVALLSALLLRTKPSNQ